LQRAMLLVILSALHLAQPSDNQWVTLSAPL
jgi:hypothetical protein